MRALKTSKCLISALAAGSLAWIEGNDPPSLESLNLPDTLAGRLTEQAFIEQSALGWNVLLRGFWSSCWRLAQEAQFRENSIREKQDTGEIWVTNAQRWFINFFESLWGLRNEGQHGIDAETQRLVRATRCERAIHRLFTVGNTLPYCEQHPFRIPKADLLSKAVINQELWVSQTELYLPKALRRVRKRAKHKQHSLVDFFDRRP